MAAATEKFITPMNGSQSAGCRSRSGEMRATIATRAEPRTGGDDVSEASDAERDGARMARIAPTAPARDACCRATGRTARARTAVDGRRSRDRTCDLSLVRAALSRLSYPPVPGFSRTCGPRSILEITPGPAKPCEAKCVAVKRLPHRRSVEQLPHRQRELAECPADLARPSRHVLFHVLREFIDLRARSRRRRPFGRRLAGLDLR